MASKIAMCALAICVRSSSRGRAAAKSGSRLKPLSPPVARAGDLKQNDRHVGSRRFSKDVARPSPIPSARFTGLPVLPNHAAPTGIRSTNLIPLLWRRATSTRSSTDGGDQQAYEVLCLVGSPSLLCLLLLPLLLFLRASKSVSKQMRRYYEHCVLTEPSYPFVSSTNDWIIYPALTAENNRNRPLLCPVDC